MAHTTQITARRRSITIHRRTVTSPTARPGTYGPEPMQSAILRVYSTTPGRDGERKPTGVAFLVDDQFALTCAHVVYGALALDEGVKPPEGAVIPIDMPLTSAPGGTIRSATVEELIPRQQGGGGDVAVLRLAAPVPGARPVRLAMSNGLWNHRAGAFGLPDGRPGGVWHSGLLKAAQANGWIQMNLDPASGGYVVSPGFSGGPVWDEVLGGVAGMMVVAEPGTPPVSYLIPTERLIAAWPRLRELTLPSSPFRSLKPFEESDQEVFCGREDDADRIAQAVARRDWVTLIGPSGSGKSSLARAGVAPLRRRVGDIPLVIRPARSSSPVRALAAELVSLLEPGSSEMDQLSKADDLANRLVQDGLHDIVPAVLARHHGARLLVVIDQFEELLDLSRNDISQLAELLSGERQPAGVAVLATLRADFVDSVLSHEALGPLVNQTFEGLMPMNRDQLSQAITAPVATVPGVYFEPGLAEQILDDAGTDPGALPLLGFTLDTLWRAQSDGQLTFQAYRALGGVTGALASYAEQAWADVPDRSKVSAQHLLPRLVRVPLGSEAPTRSVVSRTELREDEWRVAQQLAAARLLVINTRVSVSPDGILGFEAESIELAHEVLITVWPELAQMVAADNAFLTWRESLRHDTDRWEKAGRDRELLPAKPALDAADLWLPKRTQELTASQRDFLRLGLARHRTLTRRRYAVIAAVCVLVLAVTTVGFVSIRLNIDNTRAANRARANTLAATAASLTPTDPGLAAQIAVAAYRSSPTPAATNQLYATLNTPLDTTVANTGNGILQTAAQAHGPLAAVMNDNGTLRIWNTAGPAAPVLDATLHVTHSAIALAPRTDLMAAGCPTVKHYCLWSVSNPKRPVVIRQLPYPVGMHVSHWSVPSSMAFSPDGTLLAAALEDGQTVLWSTEQPSRLRPIAYMDNPVHGTPGLVAAVAFAPRGRLLATTIQNGETKLWNLQHPATPSPVATVKTGYQAVAFSPDGAFLAAAGDLNTGLWKLNNPTHPSAIQINDQCAFNAASPDFSAAAFSPDGKRLVFSGLDTNDSRSGLCSLSLDPGSLNSSVPGVTSTDTAFGIYSMSYTASGALVTGGPDGIVREWRWPSRAVSGAAPNDDDMWARAPNGNLLAAAIESGQNGSPLGIWDMAASGGPTLDTTIPFPSGLRSVNFLGKTVLLTLTDNGEAQLWNVRNPHHPVLGTDLGTVSFTTQSGTASGVVVGAGLTTNDAGTLVAVARSDRLLHIFRVNAAAETAEVGSIPVPNANADLAGFVSNDTAAVMTPTAIDWWNVANPAHPVRGSVSAFSLLKTGTTTAADNVFASTSDQGATSGNGTLNLFQVADGRVRGTARLPGLVGSTLDLSSDARTLAVTGAANNIITLWDTSDVTHPRVLSAITAGQQVDGIAFNPAGNLMADWQTTSSKVQVWNISDPTVPILEYTLTTPGGSSVRTAGFTPSGNGLTVFGDNTGTTNEASGITVDTDPNQVAARLCSYIGGTSTPAYWKRFAPGIPYQNPCRS